MSLPPGPSLPGVLQTVAYAIRPLEVLEACARRYGDAFTLRLFGQGAFVYVSSPADIRAIFTADPAVLHGGEANQMLAPFVGAASILLLDEAAHLRQRRMMLPPFHGERMQAYAQVMRAVTDQSLDVWPIDRPFALHPLMQDITLEVILRTVYGLDDAAERERFGALLTQLLDSVSAPWRMIPAFYRVDLFKLMPFARSTRLKQETDAALFAEIARRRALPPDPTRADILSLLLQARGEDGDGLADAELRDELVTLLVAGHETTATALAWAFERILAEPRVQARVEAELEAVAGTGPIEPAHLPRLEYLDATIKETLRLRPIIPITARLTAQPFTLAGHELPVGTYVIPAIALTHRRADLYERPGRFEPERFLGKKPDPYEWMPFGGGDRRCLGMAFALYEMKIVLATVFLRARLRLASRAPVVAVRRHITIAPSGGTQVVMEGRAARPARAAA